MSQASRNIIRIVIAIKLLILTGMFISIIAVGYQQLTYLSSDFPEHKDFLKEKEGVTLGLFLFSIPLVLSLVIDFKEVKANVLNREWYILTLLLLLGYILLSQLQGHYSGLFIALGMVVALVIIIKRQHQLLKDL